MELDSWLLSGITIVAGLILGALQPWVRKIEKKIPDQELSVLMKLAEIVVPLVEREFPALKGAEKLAEAIDMVQGWLSERGIHLKGKEVEGSIERAWSQFEAGGQAAAYKQVSLPTKVASAR